MAEVALSVQALSSLTIAVAGMIGLSALAIALATRPRRGMRGVLVHVVGRVTPRRRTR